MKQIMTTLSKYDAAASGLEISLTSLFRPAAEDCFTSNKEWDVWGSQNEKKEKEKEAGELSLPFDSSI